MRNSDSLLPTSSVEMKTDQFTSYSNYAKAGLIFATTTATYFLAKATGFLPNWFWGSSNSGSGELMDSALTSRESSSLVTQDILPEVAVFSPWAESEGTKIFAPTLIEPSLTDFKEADLPSVLLDLTIEDEVGKSPVTASLDRSSEDTESKDDIVIDTTLIKAGQRRLLQASSQVTVVQNIPDQTIDAVQQYRYYLDGSQIFNGNFTTLIATTAGQNVLPGWLQCRTTDTVGAYTPPSVQYRAIKIIGNIAYLADYNSGLKLIDITNPAHPVLIGSGPVGNPLSLDISATNSVIYLANDNDGGLQVVNISDPVYPTLVGSYPLSGSSGGVTIDGNFAYVVSGSPSQPIRVYVFNISDPSTVQAPIGSWSTTSPSQYGGRPVGIQIQNQRAYLATHTESPIVNVFYTLDVSNPKAPSTLAIYQSPSFFDWYPYITSFKVQGNLLYLGEQNQFIVMDISNSQNPSVLCNVGNLGGGSIRALEIYGGLAYFAMDNEGFKIINITNPTNPTTIIAQYNTFGHVYDLQVRGKFAYIADYEGGLKIIDLQKNELTGTPSISQLGKQLIVRISACELLGNCLSYEDFQLTIDSNLPQAIGNIPDQSIFPGQTLDLVISNDVLFSHADQHHLDLRLVVVNPLGSTINPWIYLGVTPSLVGEVTAGEIQYIVVRTGYAYTALNNGFQIIDVQNPENPQVLSTYPTPDFCLDIKLQDEFAYVAGASSGLLIFDVSNPSSPFLTNIYNPSGEYLRGLFLEPQSSNNLAYLVWCCNPGKLEIINIPNPWFLQSLGQLTSGIDILYMNPTTIQVQDGLAYLGNRYIGTPPQNHTLIVDVSDPANPVAVSAYPLTDFISGIALQGNILYLAGASQGLLILNISNPFTPHLLGSIKLSGSAVAQIFIQGTLAFIADMNRGLVIIDVSEPTRPQLISVTNFPTLLYSYVLRSLVYNGDFSDHNLQIMDISQRTIIGTPTTTDIGNYQATLTATDELGATATISFKIFVEGPPLINGTIPNQYAKIGQAYNYFVPQGVFTDPNDNSISFSAAQAGQSTLMSWLSFNSISATFAGTPQEKDKGNFTILLSATDYISGTVNTAFAMMVSHLPVVKQAIPDQVAGIGMLYHYTIPELTFFSQEEYPLSYSVQQSNRLPLPAWLTFNATSRQFEGQPNNSTDMGTYSIAVIVKDDYQGQTKTDFVLVVENFPTVNQSLTAPLGGVGIPFNWEIPSNMFMDLDNDPLAYTARQQDGSLLPNWLSFNPRSLVFSGVPQSTDARTLALQLSAIDPSGGQAQHNFSLTVTYFPEAKKTIPKQLANIDQIYQYTITADTFIQEDKAVLLYSVGQSDVASFPDWLSFNSTSRQLKGTPNITALGSYELQAIGTNLLGAKASTPFTLIVEHFPKQGQPLEAPLAGVDIPLSWAISPNTFIDDDNDLLSYIASQTDGLPLPNWLTFNPRSLVFSGVPDTTDVRTWNLQLSAQDPDGAGIQNIFNLTVTHFPEAKRTIPTQLADVDQLYQYTVASDTFSQADNAVLLYSAQQSSGLDLPDWLHFNATTHQLSGRPNATMTGRYELGIIVTNPVGAQAWANFSLIVEQFPKNLQPVTPPLADVGAFFNWNFPPSAFVDQDGDLLTYTARQQDGSLLPNWLSFNSRTQTFSGIPQVTDEGILPLTLSVNDDSGAQAQQSFNLTVTRFPKVAQSIPLQLIEMNSFYLYTMPLEIFTGANQSVLIYSAQQSSGASLPSWLSFNNITRQFSGHANVTVKSRYELGITATNSDSAQASANFSLIAEYFPEVQQSIIPPLANIESAFSFIVPANSFIDRDGDPLTYAAQRKNGGSLPNWLTFNPQSLSFSGVPLETDESVLPLQITATDPAGASVAQNVSIQIIHFPTLAHPQSPMTIRAGESFNFSLPRDTFEDIDRTGLSYSTKNPLPIWLTFDNQTLSFSGKTDIIESVPLILVATDARGANASMDFQLVMRGDVPPIALAGSLSNQAASVGQVFSYFSPLPLFIDPHNNTLIYSAAQQEGSPLPSWLSFDNETFHFSGIPGHGDTNFYDTRNVGVKIIAQSHEGQASASFNIVVDGVSWGELAIEIGAPVVSFVATLYAWYKARAWLLNCCRQEKHFKNIIQKHEGEKFEYRFKVTSPVDIYQVRAGIHDSAKWRCEFYKPSYRLLPGGDLLPWWMEYNADKNLLYSTVEVDKDGIGVVPPNLKHMRLELQAEDGDGIILDKIILNIMTAEKKKEEKHEIATVAGGGDIEFTSLNESKDQPSTMGIGSKKLSEGDLQESKKESPPRRTKVPSATNLIAPDSPLRQGTRTTSSMIEGDSRKKQTGRQTGDPQVSWQSRRCCG